MLVLAGNGRLAGGDARQAAGLYRQALDVAPNYAEAQNNLAWLLATHPDDQIRDGQEAVRLAEAAVRADALNPSLLDTLAAAYAEAGRFPEAVATAGKAIQLASSLNQSQLAKKIESRLPTYEAGQPWRAE